MGHQVEKTDTGVEVEVHIFNHRKDAAAYVLKSRGYAFERTEEWVLGDFDFYRGPQEGMRATVRQHGGHWRAAFWHEGNVRAVPAALVRGFPAFHGVYRTPDDVWRTVRNDAGNDIAYASAEAAIAGAKLRLGEGV